MPCSGLRRRRTDEGKGGMICHAETIIVQYFIDEESQLKVVRRYVSIVACNAATQKALTKAATWTDSHCYRRWGKRRPELATVWRHRSRPIGGAQCSLVQCCRTPKA